MPSFIEIGSPVLEKKILKFVPYMGVATILWPGLLLYTGPPPPSLPIDASYKMALIGQAVSEEKIFEIVDGRTPDHGHPISSPCEPNGSGELKIKSSVSYFPFLSAVLIVEIDAYSSLLCCCMNMYHFIHFNWICWI